MKMNSFAIAIFALSSVSVAYAANPASGKTVANNAANVRHLETTVENSGKYVGKAAINIVDNTLKDTAKKEYANNKPVSFEQVNAVRNNRLVKLFYSSIASKDRNGVTVANLHRMSGGIWERIPMPDHSHLGRLSYAQVGNLDVYFGDWSNVAPGAAVGTKGTNYTAFYSGTGRTTNLPTTGTATYTVKGINQYHTQNTALLNGTLKADFGKRTLNGEMKRTGLTVAVNNAAINTAQASFKGKATANKVAGTAHGHFFGNQGAAIAGVAEFDRNPAYNTAFGGTKTGK